MSSVFYVKNVKLLDRFSYVPLWCALHGWQGRVKNRDICHACLIAKRVVFVLGWERQTSGLLQLRASLTCPSRLKGRVKNRDIICHACIIEKRVVYVLGWERQTSGPLQCSTASRRDTVPDRHPSHLRGQRRKEGVMGEWRGHVRVLNLSSRSRKSKDNRMFIHQWHKKIVHLNFVLFTFQAFKTNSTQQLQV